MTFFGSNYLRWGVKKFFMGLGRVVVSGAFFVEML